MANEEFDIGLPQKRLKYDVTDEACCIFCGKIFVNISERSFGTLKGLQNVLLACKRRMDDVASAITARQEELLNGAITFAYHISCRSSYVSEQHLSRVTAVRDSEETVASSDADKPVRQTRSQIPTFDWKVHCFICGDVCHAKKRSSWSMVQSAIDSKSINKYTKVLKAAEERGDDAMLLRLHSVPNGDLVSVEARYHRPPRNCYMHYIDADKISSVRKSKIDSSIYDTSCEVLIAEFLPDILDGKVFLLSTIFDRYNVILTQNGLDDDSRSRYTSTKLKFKIMLKESQICFISQKGLSDLVCSSSITVGDALRKASILNSVLVSEEDNNDDVTGTTVMSDNVIVHQAIGILRQDIFSKQRDFDSYYACNEMSLSAAYQFVSPLLLNALIWLTDKHMFENALTVTGDKDLCQFKRCLYIACDVVTAVTSCPSPKHLGLAVSLYHNFGSRKLNELMYSLGYCLSYDELRRFLTSAAVHIHGQKIDSIASPGTAYIPPEIQSKADGGTGRLMVSVADNWDHNEKTVDGKRTTHAMTSIIVQNQSCDNFDAVRIARVSQYSLPSTAGDLSLVKPYKKPLRRPEPALGTSVLIDEIEKLAAHSQTHKMSAHEVIYMLLRSGLFHQSTTGCPPWSQFHHLLSTEQSMQSTEQSMQKSTIAFLPILMANATEYSTVYTTLLRLKNSMNKLGQNHTVCCFDLGLLTKACEITWANREELSNIVLIEGGMHLLMSVFAAIGHIYGDAGLKHLLCDSGVFAAGTVHQMMTGKDFDRALRGFMLVDEALNMLFYNNFKNWCERNCITTGEMSVVLSELEVVLTSSESSGSLDILMEKAALECTRLDKHIERFRQEGCDKSLTFKFWSDFLTQVMMPMKLFVKATRERNWGMYQSAKARFLPLLFAANRTNYSRYLSVMLLSMNRLPSEVLSEFEEGQFTVKISDGIFNSVWPDYAIEATENKALKGSGGIIGLTLKGSALKRWFMSRPVTAKYTVEFEKSVHSTVEPTSGCTNHSHYRHKDGTRAASELHNQNVKRLIDVFSKSFVDPFNTETAPTHLINFATGAVASKVVEQSLIAALDKGREMSRIFIDERLATEPSVGAEHISFYSPIKRSNVKTMQDMKKRTKVSNKLVTMDGEIMYLRLMAANSRKQVPLQRVMSFENAPVPLSMFTEEGILHSCQKSDFMHQLEQLVSAEVVLSVEGCDTVIFDGHAVIQSMTCTGNVTFEGQANKFLSHVIAVTKSLSGSDDAAMAKIHVIFDKYPDRSIKGQTRQKRSGIKETKIYHIRPDAQVPDWKSFLSVSENKSGLAEYFTHHMTHSGLSRIPAGITVFFSGGTGDSVCCVTDNAVTDVPSLTSNQEEADTRIVLHAVAASEAGARCITICSPDTDVLVLLLHHRPSISADKIYFHTGHGNNLRLLPVHAMFDQLSVIQQGLILPIYCITGCDTVSAFFGHGKKSAFRLLMHPNQKQVSTFSSLVTLGSSPSLSEHELAAATAFVSSLYGVHGCHSLNHIRCQKASSKKPPRCKKLPPTDDAFRLHVLRTLYQLMIWRRANEAIHMLPDPATFGYDDCDGILSPKLMLQSAAAPELLNDILCRCKPLLCTGHECPCFSNGQPCTAACDCQSLEDDDCEQQCVNIIDRDSSNSELDSD